MVTTLLLVAEDVWGFDDFSLFWFFESRISSETVINLDKELFLFLNGLGSEPFDGFWKIITKQIYWSPLFIGVFYLIQKKVQKYENPPLARHDLENQQHTDEMLFPL